MENKYYKFGAGKNITAFKTKREEGRRIYIDKVNISLLGMSIEKDTYIFGEIDSRYTEINVDEYNSILSAVENGLRIANEELHGL